MKPKKLLTFEIVAKEILFIFKNVINVAVFKIIYISCKKPDLSVNEQCKRQAYIFYIYTYIIYTIRLFSSLSVIYLQIIPLTVCFQTILM